MTRCSSPPSGAQHYKELAKEDGDFTVFYEISVSGGEAREAFCLPCLPPESAGSTTICFC